MQCPLCKAPLQVGVDTEGKEVLMDMRKQYLVYGHLGEAVIDRGGYPEEVWTVRQILGGFPLHAPLCPGAPKQAKVLSLEEKLKLLKPHGKEDKCPPPGQT